MWWHADPPLAGKIAYVPRAKRGWPLAGFTAALLAFAAFLFLAGPAAALLLRLATIMLTIAMVAGVVAFAAFRIGIAPALRSRRLG